jgi:hypothetical protein
MYLRLILIFLCIFTIGGLSCSDDDEPTSSSTIKGSGNIISRVRTLPPFHSINHSMGGDINLVSGTTQEVVVTVDDNIIDHIVTEVENEVLRIYIAQGVNLSDFNLTLDLTMTDLETIATSTPGDVISYNTFEIDSLEIAHAGAGSLTMSIDADYLFSTPNSAGNFILNGSVIRHESHCAHEGRVQCFGLYTDTTIIYLFSVGNAEVYVDSYLEVRIAGVGSLYYKGNPTIDQTITGTGQVIDAN